MTKDETRSLRLSCLAPGRLTAPALQNAMDRIDMPQTLMPGGGLTRRQIDSVRLDRLISRLTRLFRLGR